MWSKLISLAEAKQFDLLVRRGTLEQGMFEEKSLDPDMKGDLGSTNLEHTDSWLSCGARGETIIEVAIFDPMKKKKMMIGTKGVFSLGMFEVKLGIACRFCCRQMKMMQVSTVKSLPNQNRFGLGTGTDQSVSLTGSVSINFCPVSYLFLLIRGFA